MSEALYMIRMEQLLEEVSQVACSTADGEELHEIKQQAIKTLIRHFSLNLDDAESQVAAACGEEP